MIRVVLADDQMLVRQGIRTLLDSTNEFQVVADVADGLGALRHIVELRPDVALLDVRMPGGGGLHVVRTLRERNKAIPIVLLTTFDDRSVLVEAVRLRVAGFLLKDCGLEELTDTLRKAVSGATLVLPLARSCSEETQRNGVDFEASPHPEALTAREIEVLRLMASGMSNREIAEAHGTAEGTVKNQISSILSKLGVRDRTRAVLKSLELGIFSDSRRQPAHIVRPNDRRER